MLVEQHHTLYRKYMVFPLRDHFFIENAQKEIL